MDDPGNEIGNYKTIVYNTVVDYGSGNKGHDDRGDIAVEKFSLEELINFVGGAATRDDSEKGLF